MNIPQLPAGVEVPTAQGPSRVYQVGEPAVGDLIVGHGAGKGVETPDVLSMLTLAEHGWRVTLVDQPWVVAGKRVASPPPKLDAAWLEVIEHLREHGQLGGGQLVLAGRSAGARVACRTSGELNADAVVALAFPLAPPGKADQPEKWRTNEATAVVAAGRPLLIVQGERDAFGKPEMVSEAIVGAEVSAVAGTHSFTKEPADVLAAVREFLTARSTS